MPAPKRWTHATCMAFAQDWNKGMSLKQMSNIWDLSTASVQHRASILRNEGYDLSRRLVPPNERGRIAQALHDRGMSWSEVGEILQCSKQGAQQLAKQWTRRLTSRK